MSELVVAKHEGPEMGEVLDNINDHIHLVLLHGEVQKGRIDLSPCHLN